VKNLEAIGRGSSFKGVSTADIDEVKANEENLTGSL